MHEWRVREAVTFNVVWATVCGGLVFLALGLHGVRRLYVFLVPMALTILAVTFAFERIVFGRTPPEVLHLSAEVLASTASSVGASIGLLAASLTNVVIASFKRRARSE